jgi:hypothetical protein
LTVRSVDRRINLVPRPRVDGSTGDELERGNQAEEGERKETNRHRADLGGRERVEGERDGGEVGRGWERGRRVRERGEMGEVDLFMLDEEVGRRRSLTV